MKLRQLLFVILAFGALTDLSAQALNKTGQIVPTISAQQAAEIKANSLKKGTTAQQISDIINNTAKTAIPAGGAEGQVLKIVQGIAVWMDAPQTNIFYADTDGDGYGAIDNPILFISLPNGCVTNSTDCNDGDSAINPATVWYIGLDTDGDTFFGSVTSLIQCESPGAGYARTAPTTPDCNDNDATINPNMVWYLGVDADSDSYIGSVTQVTQCTSPGINYALIAPIIEDCNDDEILMNPATVWYLDADSDNYAVATTTQCTSPGAGYTATLLPLGDCSDSDAFINPATIWYLDADGDNYAASTITQCTSPGVGYRAHRANDGGSWPMPLGDCNDNDLTINPNNYWYLDADGDNFAGSGIRQCTSPGIGYTKTILLVTDCNDNDATINPVAVWYLDADGDNYAVSSTVQCAFPGVGYTAAVLPLGDCNENDATINPATVWYLDADNDSYAASTTIQCISPGAGYTQTALLLGDCNDNDATINPATVWYLDADGDNYAVATITQCAYPGVGYTATVLPLGDCSDSDATFNPTTVWYLDADGDNYAISTKTQCTNPGAGYTNTVLLVTDCNDNDATINPVAVWYLDADGDNYAVSSTVQCAFPGLGYTAAVLPLGDCNENDATINPATVWYLDADGDNYAVATITQCAYPGVGYTATVLPLGDCSDSDAFINPATIWYLDADGDNYAASTTIQCTSPGISYTITVLPLSDCNDNDATFNPTTVWYLDADGDNYAISTKTQCTNPGAGYTNTVLPLSDCNDTDGSINPGNIEDLENGIDDDCDGKIDEVDIGDLIQGGIVFWLDPENNMRGKVCYYKDATDAKIWNNAKTYCNELAVTRNTVLYDDWYLPSIDDLKLMYDNKTTINSTALANLGGSFEDYTYWSSSEFDNWGASIQSFTNGNQAHNVNKGDTGRVRAVRAFCNVQTEVPYDGIDNDCNLATLDDDLDGDGFVNANDCNDSDATINPTNVWYLDADGDNYAISTKTQCANPGAGYTATVLPLSDCNDSDATINPATVWYLDADGDNYAISIKTQCINPGVGYTATVLPLSDCNDSDGSINPGATEVRYDDIDNDCNAATLDDEAKVGDSRDGGIVFWVDPTDKAKGKVCWLLNGNNANWNDAMAYCNGLEVTRDNVLYDDWYLPSIWELNLIWWNLYESDKRNFKDHDYWSSTDNGDNYRAWLQDFSQTSADYKELKSSKAYSRAVRAF
jgi:hypothetical protein